MIAEGESELGGDHDSLAYRSERFAYHLFVEIRAIHFCRIEKRHALIHCGADQCDRFTPVRCVSSIVLSGQVLAVTRKQNRAACRRQLWSAGSGSRRPGVPGHSSAARRTHRTRADGPYSRSDAGGPERGPTVAVQRNDFAIDNDLVSIQPQRSTPKSRIHRGKVLVLPGADLKFMAILEQQSAIAIQFQLVHPFTAFW